MSTCRFHTNCAEGLAAGPAIMARFGQSLRHFAPGSAEHDLIADYLAQLCANLVLTLSPQRIILGGGVAQTPGLIEATRVLMLDRLGGYAPPAIACDNFLCAPHLGQDAGVVVALCIAGHGGAMTASLSDRSKSWQL